MMEKKTFENAVIVLNARVPNCKFKLYFDSYTNIAADTNKENSEDKLMGCGIIVTMKNGTEFDFYIINKIIEPFNLEITPFLCKINYKKTNVRITTIDLALRIIK